MTEETPFNQIEFVRLAGHPIRVTSLKREDNDGALHLVTIMRGTRDPELLRDILAGGVIDLEIPGEEAQAMAVSGMDVRHSGDGAAMVSRFGISLRPAGDVSPDEGEEPSLEARVAELERAVAELRAAVERLTPSG